MFNSELNSNLGEPKYLLAIANRQSGVTKSATMTKSGEIIVNYSGGGNEYAYLNSGNIKINGETKASFSGTSDTTKTFSVKVGDVVTITANAYDSSVTHIKSQIIVFYME